MDRALHSVRPLKGRGGRGPSVVVDVAIVALAASARVLLEALRGLVHAGIDLGTFFIPNSAWWWQRLRWPGGWNPWNFAGYPANADPQLGPLHPLGALYAVLSPVTAAAVEGALVPALGAIGMLLYLRRIGCQRAASFVGALSFGLGGFVTGHAPHVGILRAAATVPWALLVIDVLEGRLLVAGLAVVTALLLSGGHPQVVVYAFVLVAAHAVWFGRLRPPGRAIALAAGIALGGGLMAASLLPAAELFRESTRMLGSTPVFPDPRFALRDLQTLVVPFAAGGGSGPLYGAAAPGPWDCGPIECSGYVGMLPLLAILAGLPAVLRDPRGRFWLAVAAVGILGATGAAGVVLPAGGIRGPARMLLWWNVGASIAAALALGRLRPPRAWAIAAVIVGAAIVWSFMSGPAGRRAALGSIAVLGACGLALVARGRGRRGEIWLAVVCAADLASFAASLPVGITRTAYDAIRAVPAALRDAIATLPGPDAALMRTLTVPLALGSNWAALVPTPLVQGYNPLLPRSIAALLSPDARAPLNWIGWASDPSLAAPGSHVLDLLRCRLIVLPLVRDPLALAIEEAAHGDGRFEALASASTGAPRLFVNHRARPVAWLVHRVRLAPEENILALVRGTLPGADFDPGSEALSVQPITGIAPAPPTSPPPVIVAQYDEDEVRLVAEATVNALLVTSEIAYPGWQATVDGRTVGLHTVNGGFRAVVVPAGHHEVILAYRPRVVRVGIGVSAASLLVLAACVLVRRRR